MSAPTPTPRERRVLILAPLGRDAELARSVLQRTGIVASACRDISTLCDEVREGAGLLLVTEEALDAQARATLVELLRVQPPWSDLPVLVLTQRGADSPAARAARDQLGNVTLIERPVRVGALVSAANAALRARERQYQIRTHLRRQQESERALREADRRKDEFLATLAHELRNPLAPVRNSLHILRRSGAAAAASERLLGIMERQVDHMVRLVDDLMEVSRITRGRIELCCEQVDAAAALRAAIESCQPQIEAAGHVLAVDLGEQPLLLHADPVRLAQVFGNLLNNAAKYTPRGGRIWVSLHEDEGFAVVRVRDTGVGIEAAMLPRVFDMFTQVGTDERQRQGGLGIGLTLVRTLVEMHGGTVRVASPGAGRGSEFVVALPLQVGGSRAVADCSEAASLTAVALRVMVVDDNRDAADSLCAVLEAMGSTVSVHYEGASALACLDSVQPQLILLDIGMPGMDGHEVARRVRAHPGFADVPLVALTGWSQPADRMRSQAAGFDFHLVKPTPLDTLHALLAQLAAPA